MFDLGTAIAGPQAYLGGQILLGRDDNTEQEHWTRLSTELNATKTGPRKVQYPRLETLVPAQAPTPQDPLPAPPMSLQPTRGASGAPAAPVLPPPTTPEIAVPLVMNVTMRGKHRSSGQLNAMEKEHGQAGNELQRTGRICALLDR